MLSTVEDRNNVLDQSVTELGKVEVEERVQMAAFDHLEEYSGSVGVAHVAVHPCMRLVIFRQR